MTYFPMFVSLEDRPCLIVGGGRVAARKCKGLLDFGALITVIAERFPGGGFDEPALCGGKSGKRLHKIERRLQQGDLEGQDWALVVAATDDRSVNHAVAAFCRARRIPVNIADCPEECTFFFPALCREGQIAAGLTTSGTSPRMASALRRRLEEALPEWIAEMEEQERRQCR